MALKAGKKPNTKIYSRYLNFVDLNIQPVTGQNTVVADSNVIRSMKKFLYIRPLCIIIIPLCFLQKKYSISNCANSNKFIPLVTGLINSLQTFSCFFTHVIRISTTLKNSRERLHESTKDHLKSCKINLHIRKSFYVFFICMICDKYVYVKIIQPNNLSRRMSLSEGNIKQRYITMLQMLNIV